MSNQSLMVVATKYQLKVPISLKTGTWDKKGAKEKMGKAKILTREFVEQRNSHDNNEIYVIDEKATDKMVKDREVQILKNKEKAKRDNMTTADLVEAVQGGTPVAPTPKPTTTVEAISEAISEEKVMHKLTKEDIEANSVLTENGLKTGDEVELDKEGNILFESK